VAIEGDWPDVFRVNRYVGGAKNSTDASAEAALSDFRRFPRWMWRFVKTLRRSPVTAASLTSLEHVVCVALEMESSRILSNGCGCTMTNGLRHNRYQACLDRLRCAYPVTVCSCCQDLPPVGIYGLDLYSLFRSAEAVIDYLEKTDPKLAAIARERYGTLGNFRDEVRRLHTHTRHRCLWTERVHACLLCREDA
jgi:hypothetical protein